MRSVRSRNEAVTGREMYFNSKTRSTKREPKTKQKGGGKKGKPRCARTKPNKKPNKAKGVRKVSPNAPKKSNTEPFQTPKLYVNVRANFNLGKKSNTEFHDSKQSEHEKKRKKMYIYHGGA